VVEEESTEISIPSKACTFVPCSASNVCSLRKDIWSRASRILTLKRANLKPKDAQKVMFIKENLGILHKYCVSLAKGNKTEDQQYLIEMEMKLCLYWEKVMVTTLM
jgi:hypothetical protein